MKKFLMLAITILASFVFFINASADELNSTVYDSFNNDYYDESFPYCNVLFNSSGRYNFWCYNVKPYCQVGTTSIFGLNSLDYKLTTFNSDGTFRSSSQRNGGSSSRIIGDYISYDCYTQDNSTLVIEKNITFGNGSSSLYTITFNPPKNTVIVVKDSNGVEVTATSQYVYELEAGNYTYSASNSLYNSLDDISFIVSEDSTIDIDMTERLNSQPMRSIYSQYYTYISELVSNMFDIENPLFLFVISFIIGFALIVLIKRLIGGII